MEHHFVIELVLAPERVECEKSVSSGLTLIIMDESTEHVAPHDGPVVI